MLPYNEQNVSNSTVAGTELSEGPVTKMVLFEANDGSGSRTTTIEPQLESESNSDKLGELIMNILGILFFTAFVWLAIVFTIWVTFTIYQDLALLFAG